MGKEETKLNNLCQCLTVPIKHGKRHLCQCLTVEHLIIFKALKLDFLTFDRLILQISKRRLLNIKKKINE